MASGGLGACRSDYFLQLTLEGAPDFTSQLALPHLAASQARDLESKHLFLYTK